MGICESSNHGKSLDTVIKQKTKEIDKNDQTMDYQNSYQDEPGVRPSIFNKTENKLISSNQDVQNIEKPELMKYERSLQFSGKKSDANTLTLTNSSGQSEEELIIRGEINKNAKNKEEDFVNNSFKNEVKNNGGIVIQNDEFDNTLCDSQKTNTFTESGLENISEILSNKKVSNQSKNNSNMSISTIKGYNDNLIKRKNNNNLERLINGQSTQNYNIMQNNNRYGNEKLNISNNISGIKSSGSSMISQSNKINISIHSSRYDSLLNVPKTDSPLPDIDELSEKNI